MWEKLIEPLKVFLEKYFFSTILSFVGTIVIFIIIPENNPVLVKLGKELFCVFFFFVIFIFIELLKWLYHSIRIRNEKKQKALEYKKEREKIEQEEIDYLWSRIDKLDPQIRKSVKQLVTNNNSQLLLKDRVKIGLLPSDLFDTTEIKSNTYGYKLKSDMYESLIYSYEKYGKISHFE